MSDVVPHPIDVPQSVLDDIRDGLTAAHIPYAPEDGGWAWGVDTAYLRELVDYWINHYDWRVHEAHLNRHPQFSTVIDGMAIRFQHIRGTGGRGPIVLTHGWPDRSWSSTRWPIGWPFPKGSEGVPRTASIWSSRPCPASAFHNGHRLRSVRAGSRRCGGP